MAFSNLFRRYSTTNDTQPASYAYMYGNSMAETLLEELENQCRNSLSLTSVQTRRDSQVSGAASPKYNPPVNAVSAKRHSSVDYSWLTPNSNLLQTTNDSYHLSDITKMELSELILNVLPEDCTLIINQFRRQIRAQIKPSTPENIIALFRKTISDYIDQKAKTEATNSNTKSNNKTSTNNYSLIRSNRINPKRQRDDEQHCIAELTEISITSSSNDGPENNNHRRQSHSQT